MNDTDVRILMPCFDDDPAHLREAVDSLHVQTHDAWELVIVDDGSTDARTLEALEALAAERDERISVLRQENAGPAAARNRAARGARTQFLLCLDSDDRISTNFLEVTLGALRA